MGAFSKWFTNQRTVEEFRIKYNIPDDVVVRLDGERDPRDKWSYRAKSGEMPFPLVAVLEGGVRFPVHPLLRACLQKWHLVPCQLLPNCFKVIMGVVKVNEMLGLECNVHDFEDVYDVCKSNVAEDSYYFRVRVKDSAIVKGLEDNTKYAGDDRILVSGNWEFADDESIAQRSLKIPHFVGILPSKF